MITIVDYGLGNIRAFQNVYDRLNIETKIARSYYDLIDAVKIILPGVGAFDNAMTLLNNSGMREKLDELVLDKEVPILGICVGMQIMAKSSEEGILPGLGWFDSIVKKFNTQLLHHKPHLPHMGWNTITFLKDEKLFNSLEEKSKFYFLHSYYFDCNGLNYHTASAKYGVDFTCAIKNKNIYGVQFHPEKSHNNGVKVLRNFGIM